MLGLEVFVLIVVPVTIVIMCTIGLWFQGRANAAIQSDVKKLEELNAAEPEPFEHSITQNILARTRTRGQYTLPLAFGRFGSPVETEAVSDLRESGEAFMLHSILKKLKMDVHEPTLHAPRIIQQPYETADRD